MRARLATSSFNAGRNVSDGSVGPSLTAPLRSSACSECSRNPLRDSAKTRAPTEVSGSYEQELAVTPLGITSSPRPATGPDSAPPKVRMNHSGDLDRVTAEAIEAKEPDEPSLLQPEDVLHFVVRARLEDAPLQLELDYHRRKPCRPPVRRFPQVSRVSVPGLARARHRVLPEVRRLLAVVGFPLRAFRVQRVLEYRSGAIMESGLKYDDVASIY